MLLNVGFHQVRGVAVLMVVLFHTTWVFFTGGFAGVDMFFLLSGYLIASKLTNVDGRTVVKQFYVKRVRKIFPSLIVTVVLTVGLFWWLWGWCEDTVVFLQHGILSLLGVSNFLFASEATTLQHSYSPFLHLWSVAIEIQFYVFAPLLFFFFKKTRLNLQAVLHSITVLSFLTYIILLTQDTVFAYYFTGSRVWLFTLGASLLLTPPVEQKLAKIFTITGSTMLTFYFLLYSFIGDNSPTYSLFPVLATTLIMLGVKDTPSQKLSDTKWFQQPLLFLGNISYPLYLVHYPVMFFVHNFYSEYMWLGLVFSIMLAWLTHVLVEKPFIVKTGLKTV